MSRGDAISQDTVQKAINADQDRTLGVGLLVYEGANILDLAGPLQVFATAAEQGLRLGIAHKAYAPKVLATKAGLVVTSSGAAIQAESIFDQPVGAFDTVLVVGGHGAVAAAEDPAVRAWLRAMRGDCRRIGSICTGTYLLAAAGVLNGHRVASHWAYCADLARRHPDIVVDPDALFIESDGIWTSAGVTAGLDMAVALVERDFGRALALETARRLVFFLQRPGSQSQFSVHLESQAVAGGALQRAIDQVLADPSGRIDVEDLARRANMSLRALYRAFRTQLGTTPAEFLERARVETARRLLEEVSSGVERVASRSGFANAEAMRRAFRRRLGVSPTDYRDRFASTWRGGLDAHGAQGLD
jgi:transcriptional regulator GlxA family with amidase domain